MTACGHSQDDRAQSRAGCRMAKSNPMSNSYIRAAGKFLQLPAIPAILVFLPAWTLDYWQGWLFSAVFVACTLAITLYLAVRDPQLLERRMNAGPGAEKE